MTAASAEAWTRPTRPTRSARAGFDTLPAGDYLVSLAIPDDLSGDPMYKATGEEDINIGNGNDIVPQVPPPACAGARHVVDVAGIDAEGDLADPAQR